MAGDPGKAPERRLRRLCGRGEPPLRRRRRLHRRRISKPPLRRIERRARSERREQREQDCAGAQREHCRIDEIPQTVSCTIRGRLESADIVCTIHGDDPPRREDRRANLPAALVALRATPERAEPGSALEGLPNKVLAAEYRTALPKERTRRRDRADDPAARGTPACTANTDPAFEDVTPESAQASRTP